MFDYFFSIVPLSLTQEQRRILTLELMCYMNYNPVPVTHKKKGNKYEFFVDYRGYFEKHLATFISNSSLSEKINAILLTSPPAR